MSPKSGSLFDSGSTQNDSEQQQEMKLMPSTSYSISEKFSFQTDSKGNPMNFVIEGSNTDQENDYIFKAKSEGTYILVFSNVLEGNSFRLGVYNYNFSESQ